MVVINKISNITIPNTAGSDIYGSYEDIILITGSDFVAKPVLVLFSLNGNQITISDVEFVDSRNIKMKLPNLSVGSYTIYYRDSIASGSNNAFSQNFILVRDPPKINSLSNDYGIANQIINASGSRFLEGVRVKFNDIFLDTQFINGNKLTFITPKTSGNYIVSIVNPDGGISKLSNPFTVYNVENLVLNNTGSTINTVVDDSNKSLNELDKLLALILDFIENSSKTTPEIRSTYDKLVTTVDTISKNNDLLEYAINKLS